MNACIRLMGLLSLSTFLAACGGGGGSGPTQPPPIQQAPAAPDIQVTSIGVSNAWLDWPPVADATGYRVYFATQSGVTPLNYTTLPNSGMEFAPEPPHNVWLALENELYHVIVTATNEAGESIPSNEVSVRPWGEVVAASFRPPERALMPGASSWFQLDGTVTGGQPRNVTERATWISSDPDVVSIGTFEDDVQFVDGVTPGQATITATVDSLVLNADVRVWPITRLEQGVPFAIGADMPAVGIDDAGNALLGWSYPLAGEMRVYGYDPANGWSGPVLLDAMGDRVVEPRLDVAGSGVATLAWYGLDGIYAAAYTPAQGWQGTEQLSTTGFDVRVATGADGSSVALWADPDTNRIVASTFTSGGGWTAPQDFAERGSAAGDFDLVGNESGTAVAVWQSWEVNPGDPWLLLAAIYEPGSGWGAPTILNQQNTSTGAWVDITEDGRIAVAWLDDAASEGIHLSLYEPGNGWLAPEIVQLEVAARVPRVVILDSGAIVVSWMGGGNYNIYTRRRGPAGSWDATGILVDNVFGSRTVHMVQDDPDGIVLIEVGQRTVSDMPWARVHRYVDTLGWQDEEILHAGIGIMSPSLMSGSPSGRTILVWNEHYSVFDGAVFDEHEDLLVIVDP